MVNNGKLYVFFSLSNEAELGYNKIENEAWSDDVVVQSRHTVHVASICLRPYSRNKTSSWLRILF